MSIFLFWRILVHRNRWVFWLHASSVLAESWPSLFNSIAAEEMCLCFLNEWDIDCCSKLTFLGSPILLDLVGELFNFDFIFFVFSVWNKKTAVLSFVFEEILLCTCVHTVHIVVNIFNPLHFRHVLDVVDHVEVDVAHLAIIWVGFPSFFLYFNRLRELNK